MPDYRPAERQFQIGAEGAELDAGDSSARIVNITKRCGIIKDSYARLGVVGLAEEVFQRLRTTFEGEFTDRMAALSTRTKLSPGVLKTLMRLATNEGISMGDMARGIGCDPSYITALVDDLDARGLARREAATYDRRVKTIVLTDAGRALAEEISAIVAVPPASFAALSAAELRQLRDLLNKVIAADQRSADLGVLTTAS